MRMTSCPANHRLILRLVFGFCFFSLGASGFGQQDAEDFGKAELERQGFNWYEESNQSTQDLWRFKLKRAKSQNRRNVAGGTDDQSTSPNYNFGNWWLPMFNTGTWIMLMVLFAVILAIIVWFSLQLEARSGNVLNSLELEEEDLEYRIQQLPFELNDTTKGDLNMLAVRAANRGDHDKAVMLLFSHVLILLDRKDLIRLRKGKTNRQYLNEIRRHPDLTKYYEQVMVPFEDSFFGDHTVNKERFESCFNALDEFHRNVEESTQSVAV